MTDRLYRLRAAAERAIVDCDERLKLRPNDDTLITARRHYARLAARWHACIERMEQSYAEA